MTDGQGDGGTVGSGTTYLLIDGENIDATLGNLLDRRPEPGERPRWDRVLSFAASTWGGPVKSFFFINASSGHLPVSFVQALVNIGIRPIPLSGRADQKVVDLGIQKTLDAIAATDGDVMLATHDGDFLPQVERLVGGERRVGLLAFPELANGCYSNLEGVEIFDLEEEVGCFNQVLPRLRIIDVDQFDPTAYL
jgi:uncharacterized protein